jgi:F0F1-type ATP synthase assembly protein I
MALVAGPAVGYWIGDALDQFFSTSPWLMVFFTVFGVISSIRQTALLIKRGGQ